MLKRLLLSPRTKLLSAINRMRLREVLDQVHEDATPIFFIFTPEISHFAPYCIPQVDSRFSPVLLTNAVPDLDVEWIRSLHPHLPVVPLKNSLRRASPSLLLHGDVLNDLFAVARRDFCIQDPDCFVTDPVFWDQVSLGSNDFAGGAFWDQGANLQHVLPHTFLMIFNVSVFRAVAAKYGIDANITKSMPPRALSAAASLGYGPGKYPHDFKGYFDTLQTYWITSLSEGFDFKKMSGGHELVYHIGGTSYLFKSDIDLSHGDFWPLGVQYFNLRLLELPLGARFRGRFKALIDAYGNSERLLAGTPEFRDGWRRAELDRILDLVTR